MRDNLPDQSVILHLRRPYHGLRVLTGDLTVDGGYSLEVGDNNFPDDWVIDAWQPRSQQFERDIGVLAEPGGLTGHERRVELAERVVHRVDVDGDGRADIVTMRWVRLRDPAVATGRILIRLQLATGRTITRTFAIQDASLPGPTDDTVGLPWDGAGNVDGRPGAEIAVRFAMGASFDFDELLTLQNGQLIVLPPPHPLGGTWTVGGYAAGPNISWGCRNGVVLTQVLSQSYNGKTGRFNRVHGFRIRWRWSGYNWVSLSRQRLTSWVNGPDPTATCLRWSHL